MNLAQCRLLLGAVPSCGDADGEAPSMPNVAAAPAEHHPQTEREDPINVVIETIQMVAKVLTKRNRK